MARATSTPWLRSSESDFSFRAGDKVIHDLGVVSLKVTEGISRLFNVQVDLASEDRDLPLEELVGRPGVLRINHFDPELDRFVNGIISRFEYVGEGVSFARYEAELVPLVWLLGLRHKSRIFQNMTVPDIIKQVLTDAGIPKDNFKMLLTGQYEEREYCVQYRETELNFIQRLLEEEGIYYFFTHTEQDHVMIMADAPSAHQPIPGELEVTFREPSAMVPSEEYISHFRFGRQVRPGAVMLRDFEFKNPTLNLDSTQEHEKDKTLEIYDYPGEYKKQNVGQNYAKVRLQELQVDRSKGRGVSTCRRLIPGHRFKLVDHIRSDFNGEYLITSVSHRGTQPQMLEAEPGATVEEGPGYESVIEVIPFQTPFRPPRLTPRPVVQGTQTAIVVGPGGEEIYTDEHGRVKVHFHWDREGVFDEKASCWIRVSQAWAGGMYGAVFLPRIGHEVIVDFLEGDPDQPIITGRVYNGDEKPPYKLPDEKTKSTIRTANSKGQDGANEFRFEDKKGEEQIFLHAQKDLHIRALNDRVVNIENDSHETIDGQHREKVKKSRSRSVDGNESIAVGGNRSLKVKGNVVEEFKGDHTEKTDGNFLVKAQSILIEASMGLSIKGPGGHVTINPAGVYVTGNMVFINSGGSPQTVMAGQLASPAAPIEADEVSTGQDVDYSGTSQKPQKVKPDKLDEKSWIEISLKDEDGNPVPGEYYVIRTSDGRELDGNLDVNGEARIEGIEPGSCRICFPHRAPNEWRRA